LRSRLSGETFIFHNNFDVNQVGAASQMSNVSIYIVDLKKVQPFGFPRAPVPGGPGIVTVVNTGGSGTEFKTGTHVRRSFIKEKPDQNGVRPR
jgi:hypothetical protein